MLIVVLALSAAILSVSVSSIQRVRAVGGCVHGVVLWLDQYNDAHPMAWAQVTAENGRLPPITAYTTDGTYVMWLPEGTWSITASSSPGFFPDAKSGVVVSPGSSTGIDFFLKPTGQPIPELPPWAQPLILLCAVLITAVAVRRHKAEPRT